MEDNIPSGRLRICERFEKI